VEDLLEALKKTCVYVAEVEPTRVRETDRGRPGDLTPAPADVRDSDPAE
jgi:hypothetical protein